MQSIIILGRQPKIGLAELEALFSAEKVQQIMPQVALVDLAADKIPFNRLGGALKLGQVITRTEPNKIIDSILSTLPAYNLKSSSKINLGISYYGHSLSVRELGTLGLKLKKELKSVGLNIRIVPNRQPSLNTAQVYHNKLTTNNGLELLIVPHKNQLLIARGVAVQNIASYTARDRGRPKRDSYVGMLPPKLAQIMINLASTSLDSTNKQLLDPFCGTGVVLQEALLMGYSVYGSDINQRVTDFTKTNLDWLQSKFPELDRKYHLETADAQNNTWQPPIDLVVSETFLGKPLNHLLPIDQLRTMAQEINVLHKKFLQNLAGQISSGTRLCLAVPAWQTKNGFLRLAMLDQLTDLGYNRVVLKHADSNDLIYHRPDQLVARELIILTRK